MSSRVVSALAWKDRPPEVVASATMGTVLPNKTPLAAVPFLRLLDGKSPLGFYAVAIGRVA